MEFKRIISGLKDFFRMKFDRKYTIFLTAFAISVLVKFVLFTIKVNGSMHIASGVDGSPFGGFLLAYSIYVGVALFFVALGACSKFFWPAFLLDLILDVWILANLLSLRFHGIMITGYDFRLIGNMNGFWDSLLAFIYFSDILMFLVTGAFIFVYFKYFKPYRRRWITGLILLVISALLIIIKPIRFNKLWGMQINILEQVNVSGEGMDEYAANYTIFMNLLADIYFCNTLDNLPKPEELTDEEKEEISKYMIEPQGKDTLRDNLLIIFVESMEGWTLNTSINGQEITPNINSLTKRNAIYTEKMYPMTQRGSSSDAQLMVNTGLLPLIYEATCYAYEGNYYYSIGDAMARLGSHNVMIVPTNPAAWNQSRISKPWGFPTMYGHDVTDGELFEEVATLFDTIQEPFFIETVTMASHSPFIRSAHLSELDIPEGLPKYKENYIRSLNYTDKCIGEFINKVKNSPKFERTTIVVLGDHCIFSSNREEFEESEIGRSLNANRYGGGYIPFIVSSPNNIKECREITNVSRQCDIYKTLLSILKLDNYPWRSFGCDRSTPEPGDWGSDADGYRLSERIIRNDYFRTIEENK